MNLRPFLISALLLTTFLILLVPASGAPSTRTDIYVDDSGGKDHTTIQAAVDAANPGDTIYIWDGTYNENVVIDKNLTLIGNGSQTTIVDGGDIIDVISITAAQCNISGLMIRQSGVEHCGIDMRYVDNSTIENCTIYHTKYGICADLDSNNNTIQFNTVYDTSHVGIWMRGDGNFIRNNTVYSNPTGIAATGDHNTVKGNHLDENIYSGQLGVFANEMLHIGNSYTGANSLDILVDAAFQPRIPNHDSFPLSGGGMTLDDHATNALTPGHQWNDTLNGGHKWNYVFLQDQSQIPGFPTDNTYWIDSKEGAKVLNNMTRDIGAETVFMMTWGRRDGDSMNPTRYNNFTSMQAHLENGYNWYAENCTQPGRPVFIAPVGLAFKHIHDNIQAEGTDPTTAGTLFYDLYSSDGSHPSQAGSYLAAYTIYATITGKSPVGVRSGPSLNATYHRMLQEAAAETVLNNTPDYLYPWQIGKGLEFSSNATVSFNTFINSTGIGMAILEAENKDNVLHHNDLLNNQLQAKDMSENNEWDDGAQGNFWTDYESRYPSATNDGTVWDTPYTMEKGTDRFPLFKGMTDIDFTPPIARAGPDQTVDEGTLVSFNGTASTDNVAIVNFTWTFTYQSLEVLYGSNPTFQFDDPGNYSVSLQVMDAMGLTSSDSLWVNVSVVPIVDTTPPVAPSGLALNQSVDRGDYVYFETDDWTDEISFITNYTWRFDYDGSPVELYEKFAYFIFNIEGNYSCTLNVTNSANLSTEVNFWVDVFADVTPPIADAGGPYIVDEDRTFTLDARNSSDDIKIVSYDWLIYDLIWRASSGMMTQYIFEHPGTYEIELNISDEWGNWDTDLTTVTVKDTTDPVADAGDNLTIEQGDEVTLNWSASTDNVGITNVKWSVFPTSGFSHLGNGTYVFHQVGMYFLTLNVSDAAGNYDIDFTTIDVIDVTPPIATIVASSTKVSIGELIELQGNTSTDNSGGTQGISKYLWLVDGEEKQGERITVNFYEPGAYSISLTVTDFSGLTNTTWVVVEVEDGDTNPFPDGNGTVDGGDGDGDGDGNSSSGITMLFAIIGIMVLLIIIVIVIIIVVLTQKQQQEARQELAAEVGGEDALSETDMDMDRELTALFSDEAGPGPSEIDDEGLNLEEEEEQEKQMDGEDAIEDEGEKEFEDEEDDTDYDEDTLGYSELNDDFGPDDHYYDDDDDFT